MDPITKLMEKRRAKSLHAQFNAFAMFGGEDNISGDRITLTNTDMWLTQAKILDELNLSHTDTGICFSKMKKSSITYQEFVKFLEDLASFKGLDVVDMKTKLRQCGLPGQDDKKNEKKKTES